MTAPSAGFLRVRGAGQDGFPLVGPDVRIDVMQADGVWIPFRGCVSIDLSARGDAIVTATMVVEIHYLDVGSIPLDQVSIRWLDMMESRLTLWQRVARWVRGVKPMGAATRCPHP